MNKITLTFMLVIALILAGCSSGGIQTTPGGTAATAAQVATVQGVYSGTFNATLNGTVYSGEPFYTIILPDDTVYGIYGIPLGSNPFVAVGLIVGQQISLNSTAGTYAFSGKNYQYTDLAGDEKVATATVTGTYTTGSTASLTGTESVSGATFKGSIPSSTQINFNTPALVSNIVGTWTAGSSFSMKVLADGTFTGTETLTGACTFSGKFTPDSSNLNFFRMSFVTTTGCSNNAQTYTGVAVIYLTSGTTYQMVAGGVTSSATLSEQFTATMTK